MDLNDPELVAAQYADERALAARRRVWNEFADGPNGDDVTFEAVVETAPRRLLEVGCGWGGMAERIARGTDADVTALDASARMVELARSRGVRAFVASADALPFRDASSDTVLANAMLYHVPDLDRGLDEIARVLTDQGYLIATTFGADNLREVWELVGDPAVDLSFSRENGEELLRRRFGQVELRRVTRTVTFPDADEVRTYVASTITRGAYADRVPAFEGPFVAHGDYAVFVARRPLR
jgi:SAM-dependent methyltransferase